MKFLRFGGLSGIALALCKQLIVRGDRVHLITRKRDEKIIEIASNLKILEVHECDIQDSPRALKLILQIDETIGRLGGLAFFR